jgi:deoxyribose-phosphate aldolase
MPPIASERVAAHPNVPAGPLPRNPGLPLDLDWVAAVRVDRSASERRAATLGTRRSVKADAQAAWLLKAITLIDLTTLAGDDTPGRVRRLCAKARSPVRPDLLSALGMADVPLTTGAVCVYHAMVPTAVAALEGSGVPVAAVATGFPAGLTPLETRLAEIRASVAAGAEEIDVVIARHQALAGDWAALYDELRSFREACGPAHLKVILGTGDLGPLRTVARASLGRHDGGGGLRQDLDRQGGRQRHPARVADDGAHDPRLRRAHRLRGGVQAGRRHPHRQGRARLDGAHARGARPALVRERPLPLRRQRPARRHRAAARAPRDRALRGAAQAAVGVSARPPHEDDAAPATAEAPADPAPSPAAPPDPAPPHAFALRLDAELALRLRERHHAAPLYARLDRERAHLRSAFAWAERVTPQEVEAMTAAGLEQFRRGDGWHADLCWRGEPSGRWGCTT